MTVKDKLLWVWQFPQNIAGFVLTRFDKATAQVAMNDRSVVTVHYTSNVFNCGVSLGKYVILDYKVYYGKKVYRRRSKKNVWSLVKHMNCSQIK